MPDRTAPDARTIGQAVHARTPWLITTLRELIGLDSVAPNERVCQEALAAAMQREGLDVHLAPMNATRLPAAPGYIDSGLPLDNRPNVVVRWRGYGPGGRSLILNSHMDTVPWQENREQWQDHPLAGALRDGRIYGRGSVDAKGQVMAALGAVLALADLGFCPHGDVIVESVVSEEPDGNGTLALCSEGWLADAAIVLEPTDCQVCYGHRGIVGLRYTVTGHAGHAALGRPRNSAIVTAARFAIALDRALEDWSAPGDGAYGAPVLNVGRIVGGESIFTVAPLCEIECGVRYAPGAYDAVLQHIKDRVAHEAKAATISQVDMRVFSHYDAMSTSPQGPLASGLLTCVQRVRPDRKLTTFPAGCDARHFTNRFGIPAVIFGPGQLNTAHAVDENLPLEDWLLAIQALAAFIVEWCG